MSGELSFIEIGVEDAALGRAFYSALFGWSFDPAPGDGGGYTIIGAGAPAGVHGGDRAAAPYVFFRVDDMDAAIARVVELGGSADASDVSGDEESAATFGQFRLCHDDQGSPFGLHQAPAA